MRISTYPFQFNFREVFPDAKMIKGLEGGVIYKASKDNKKYLIIDEGTMADFLDVNDKDLLDRLIRIIEFNTEDELNNYIVEHYGKLSLRTASSKS
jgi:hypothetical protein